MSRRNCILIVLALLLGQPAASAQALAMGGCHHRSPEHHASAGAEHVLHAHHVTYQDTDEPDQSHETACCHCVTNVHCGQLTVVAADLTPQHTLPAAGPSYPPTLVRQPMLPHRRKLDRPPA